MKSNDARVLEFASLEYSTTWGWSTDGEHSVMFRFEEAAGSAVWGAAGLPLDWSKEIEKKLN